MIRMVLSEEQWERVAPLLPGKEGDPGRSGDNNRMFIEGVLWIVRTGAPWRDLPNCFGNWFSVWKRFRRWALKGVFERVGIIAIHENNIFDKMIAKLPDEHVKALDKRYGPITLEPRIGQPDDTTVVPSGFLSPSYARARAASARGRGALGDQ